MQQRNDRQKVCNRTAVNLLPCSINLVSHSIDVSVMLLRYNEKITRYGAWSKRCIHHLLVAYLTRCRAAAVVVYVHCCRLQNNTSIAVLVVKEGAVI